MIRARYRALEMSTSPRPLGQVTCLLFLQQITPYVPVRFPPLDSETGLPSLPRADHPSRKGPLKGIRGDRAQTLVTSALSQQRARLHAAATRVPCWPPCTDKSTAACHSCPRKPWARSSRCSRGRRGLREGHSSMRQGDGYCPAGSSFQP